MPETPIGHPTMLKLPGDDFVTIELVHDPGRPASLASGLSHLVVQVESTSATLAQLAGRGIETEPPTRPDETDDFLTSCIVDPDGNRIELVQCPATPRA